MSPLKKFRAIIICFPLILLVIVACAPAPTPMPVLTSTSVPTRVAIAKATATNTPEPTATWTLTATNTATPTNTLAPTFIPTPSRTATPVDESGLVDIFGKETTETMGTKRPRYLKEYFSPGPADRYRVPCNRGDVVRTLEFEGRLRQYCYTWFSERPGRALANGFSNTVADATYLLTIPNPNEMVDENGTRLRINVGGHPGLIYWRKPTGEALVMPFMFPRQKNGIEVVPLMKWSGKAEKRTLTEWQIWLIDKNTKQPLIKIERPFVSIQPDESIRFNGATGYYEVAKLVAHSFVLTGQKIGLQLKEPIPVIPTQEPIPIIATVDGIRLLQGLSSADVLYLKESLSFLQQRAPKWYQYIISAEPFDFSWKDTFGFPSSEAQGNCCSVLGRGQVDFKVHPSEYGNLNEDRIRFLSIFVHEVTHVMDMRAGKRGCLVLERSAITMQVEFIHEMNPTSDSFVSRLEQKLADPELLGYCISQ